MDNPRFNQAMQSIIESNSLEAQKIEPSINLKLQSALQSCFSRSGDNADRFASCMLDTQKKLDEIAQAFQFKNLFLSTTVQNCLNNNTDFNKCTNDGKNLFKNITSSLLKQIQKI